MQPAGTSQTCHALESNQREPGHFCKLLRALLFLQRSAAMGPAREAARAYCDAWRLGPGPADLLVDFARRLPTRRYETGSMVYQEGERDDALCVLLSGSATMRRSGVGDLRQLLPADAFGEISAIHGVGRTETVIALDPLEVAIVPSTPLHALAGHVAPIAHELRATAEARLTAQLFPTRSPFSILDDRLKSTLLSRMRGRTVARGSHLLRQGQSPAVSVIVFAGRAETWRGQDGGDRVVGEPLGPGDVFGSRAILDGAPADYHVVASTTLTLFGIRPDDLSALGTHSTAIQQALREPDPVTVSSRPVRSTGEWSPPPWVRSRRS